MAVDEANEHIISVWDLSRERPHKITETKVRLLFSGLDVCLAGVGGRGWH